MPGRQTAIACTLMRGGTSKGPFFLASDLPAQAAARDRVLLAVMARQTCDKSTAWAAPSRSPASRDRIASQRPGVDVDFLFAQVLIDKPLVDVSPNCGNMLAAVGPFAIERAWWRQPIR